MEQGVVRLSQWSARDGEKGIICSAGTVIQNVVRSGGEFNKVSSSVIRRTKYSKVVFIMKTPPSVIL